MTANATHTSNASISERLAEFVCSLTLDDVPTPVIEVARQHFLDAIGIAVASSDMDYARAARRAVNALSEPGSAHLLGFGDSVSPSSAALGNGVLIHGLDFDDTHIGAIYHATAPALAAALAVGEDENSSGQDVLLAYIIGLEVGCRLANVGSGTFHARGFHPTGIAGTFAAACVAGSLRKDSAQTITNALGLCGSQAAGILEVGESWLKRFHPGWAAHAGIVAATFAKAGFLGPDTVFEGERGLYATHLGDVAQLERLGLDTLGSVWMTRDIALKPYPCCHFTHAFIDAAGFALDQLGLSTLQADLVESIECPTAPGIIPAVAEPAEVKVAPKTLYQSLFSIQYAVALRLVRGAVELSAFYDEDFDDPRVLAMASKVVCKPDETADFPAHFPGAITINLYDGRTISITVADSLGTPQRPLDADGVAAKFTSNAQRVLPTDRVAEIKSIVDSLEQLENIADLLAATRRTK